MKKNLITLIIVLLLSAVAFFLYKNNSKGTIKEELKDFAIQDTASITKIFLADKNNNKILLARQKNGTWLVNNKFEARADAIKKLLETMHDVTVKAPVGKASFNTVVKLLAATGKKVEIYKGEKLIKTYYVGDPTDDNLGTYMMIENSARPFICWIQGFNGYLSSRYFTSEDEWKSKIFLKYKINEISTIRINYFREPENSFEIKKEAKQLSVKKLINNTNVDNIDTLLVAEYLMNFTNLGYSANLNFITQGRKDTIMANSPMYIFELTTNANKTFKITAFPKKADDGGPIIINDKEYEYDPDVMYAYFNNDKTDWYTLQYYVMDKILLPVSYFEKKSLIKK